ncbi:MAG: hypothetical protein QOE70_681 [Chthoniobacter sp.]|jgi:uncharacterized protein (TIGR02597 family)|nr:hypothetical protein [Chthoniobacter sp.]
MFQFYARFMNCLPALCRSALAILAAACLLPAFAETTAPIGFVTITVPAGVTRAICLPIHDQPAFVGAVSEVTYDASSGTTPAASGQERKAAASPIAATASSRQKQAPSLPSRAASETAVSPPPGATTITVTGANWGSFGPFATNPHVARFRTGSSSGRSYQISSNTPNSLTFSGVDLTSLVAVNEQFEIVPIDTLSSLFGANAATAGFATNPQIALADKVYLRGADGWLTVYNDGQHWLQDTGANADHFALLPDTGFLISRVATSDLSLVLRGSVPITNFAADLPDQKTTVLASYFPVDTTLDGLKLQDSPGWVKDKNPAVADNVYVQGASGWLTFYHDGASWVQLGGGALNPPITVGTAVVVARKGTTPAIYNRPPPYSAN